MSPADSWQRSGMSSDRSYPSGSAPRYERSSADEYGRPSRSVPPPPPPKPRGRAADRPRPAERSRGTERSRGAERARPAERSRSVDWNAGLERSNHGHSDEFARPPASRRSEAGGSGRGERGMPADRAMAGDRGRRDRDMREPSADRRTRRPAPEELRATERGGSRLRGIVAVLGVFLVSLAGAAIDSFLGVGLGLVTLVALVGSTALATLLVRRRDAVSVIVSPPLVFVLVAAVNVSLAPSASFSLTTLATLMVRGFPAMGIATGVALLIGLFRLATRR